MVGSRRGGGRADAKHDRVRAATWRVRVRDAVGLVAVGDLQLVVQPKIPRSHLLYLLAEAEAIPRLDEQRGALAAGLSLWELIALWFLDAAEHVLRLDLIRDYTLLRTSFSLFAAGSPSYRLVALTTRDGSRSSASTTISARTRP